MKLWEKSHEVNFPLFSSTGQILTELPLQVPKVEKNDRIQRMVTKHLQIRSIRKGNVDDLVYRF